MKEAVSSITDDISKTATHFKASTNQDITKVVLVGQLDDMSEMLTGLQETVMQEVVLGDSYLHIQNTKVHTQDTQYTRQELGVTCFLCGECRIVLLFVLMIGVGILTELDLHRVVSLSAPGTVVGSVNGQCVVRLKNKVGLVDDILLLAIQRPNVYGLV